MAELTSEAAMNTVTTAFGGTRQSQLQVAIRTPRRNFALHGVVSYYVQYYETITILH